jgi:hypothetical protein
LAHNMFFSGALFLVLPESVVRINQVEYLSQ